VSRFLLTCLGGAAGTGARHLTSVGTMRLFGTGFPTGTLALNLIGSFLLCAFPGMPAPWIGSDARLILGTGVSGAFTADSAFNLGDADAPARGTRSRSARRRG
jgi:CrcB protein